MAQNLLGGAAWYSTVHMAALNLISSSQNSWQTAVFANVCAGLREEEENGRAARCSC